jgi:hypothetical protein
MERVKAALVAIRADQARGIEEIERGVAEDGRPFVAGLVAWIATALGGCVIDPD